MSHTLELVSQFNEIVLNYTNHNNDNETIPKDFDNLIYKCSLNLSTLTSLDFNPQETLNSIKSLLLTNCNIIDTEVLLELLDNIIDLSSFEDVLVTYSIEDLQRALASDIVPLIQSACKIIAKSYPKAIFASTILFDILLDLYFKEDTNIVIINDIELIWNNLVSDPLVRTNIISNNYLLLEKIKLKFKSVPMTRLLKLLLLIFENGLTPNEFNSKLYILSLDDMIKATNMDILLLIHIIRFYADIITTINTQMNLQWAVPHLRNVILIYGKLFKNRKEYPEIQHFAMTYLFKFFQNISYLDDSDADNFLLFETIDEEYLNISLDNEYIDDFLSFVNPNYLLAKHKKLLQDYIVLKPSQLGIIRNLISSRNSFNLIKNELSSDNILLMPYMEQMVLLQKLTQYDYSSHYLLYELPKVMSHLLDIPEGPITEPETVSLRNEVIDNLMRLEKDDLNVWYLPLSKEYSRIHNGIDPEKTVQTRIASSFLQ